MLPSAGYFKVGAIVKGNSDATKAKLTQTFRPYINATVIKGEIVNKLQAIIGLKAESSNGINFINGPSTFWINVYATLSNVSYSPLETVEEYALRVKAHLIDELKTALNCSN